MAELLGRVPVIPHVGYGPTRLKLRPTNLTKVSIPPGNPNLTEQDKTNVRIEAFWELFHPTSSASE